MAANPSSLARRMNDWRGDDAVGLGLAADKVHGHLFAGKARNEVYMDDGEFARRVDPLHQCGDIADIAI